ncbi:MAG TPA: hypothetical protein VFA09_24650 [Ktedonobacteraceae bacterium]|jgi:hypothetical protein|nr:hypothetical protein [Ktedonobacteraceae bacterium]
MSERFFAGTHIQRIADDKPLAHIRVLMYVRHPNGEISYDLLGEVKTEEELVEIMTHLPNGCGSVEIYLFLRGRIVGNANYGVYREIDEQSGKWEYLNADEYGACVGLWRLFDDRFAYVDYFEN